MTYRYDVFISYRHQDLDKKWANWLIRALEAYRPPRSLAAALRKVGRPWKISRVFRDEDETAAGGNLSERLKEALRESRSLVVICSRNTPESTWIDSEIEYFKSLGRADQVLPLLVDGEPGDSFPSTIHGHTEMHGGDLGAGTPIVLEPLAADARPRKGLSSREVKHRALLKVVAGALNLRFDDLYQRDRRRRRIRLVTLASTVALLLTIWLGWLTWTRTDTYQVNSVLATAPLLLPSALGDDVADWCRALVLSGHFDHALTAAESASDFAGGRIEAFLATAEAARAVDREADAEQLMMKASELSKNYNPAFTMELRLKTAQSLFKQERAMEAKRVIEEAIAATRLISNPWEKVTSIQRFADLVVEMGETDYLSQLTQNDSDPIVAAVSSIVAARAMAKSGQSSEIQPLIARAIEMSQHREVGEHQSYLVAWTVASAAALGALQTADGLLVRSLAMARQIPSSEARSHSLRQIADAMSQLQRIDEAMAVLDVILETNERDDTSQLIAKAFARAGKPEGIEAILNRYPDDGFSLVRYSVVSAIAEGLAEGGHLRLLSQFEDRLSAYEQVEIRIIAAETERKLGQNAYRDSLLNEALQVAQARQNTDERDESLSRIADEMIVSGRLEDALAIARRISDSHTRTFTLLAVAKSNMSLQGLGQPRELLTEAVTIEEAVRDPDLRAAGFLEIGRAFRGAGDIQEAMELFRRAVAAAAEGGEYGSSTIADVAEEYARLGELRLARTVADQYCDDGDRLRVYTTILNASRDITKEGEKHVKL